MSDTFDRARLISFFCIAVACASIAATPAQAQSCSAMITPTVLSAPPFLVGDTVRVNLLIGPETIQGGTNITIPEVLHKLDCLDGGLFEFCDDEGLVMVVPETDPDSPETVNLNNLNIGTDCATTWVPAFAAGDLNQLVFDASPDLILTERQQCNISFDLQVLNTGNDNTPNLIQEASKFSGFCDNSLVAQARGTLGILLADCDVAVDKQVSCDGGASWQDQGFEDGTIEGCTALDGQPVLVRYFAANPGNLALECSLIDSNGAILGVPVNVGTLAAGFVGEVTASDPLTCNDGLDAAEPDTATLSCTCQVDQTLIEAIDTDQADIDCEACNVQVDRQVSCDGGGSWQDTGFNDGGTDGCSTIDDNPVLVRYLANNGSDNELQNCFLSDSNFGVLPTAVDIGTLAVGDNGIIFATDELTCNDTLDGNEPGTATLTCECANDSQPEPVPVEDTDTAQFECVGCDVQVDRQVSCDDGASWQDTGFGDGTIDGCDTLDDEGVLVRYLANNPSDIPLDNCILTDSNGGVLGAPVAIGSLIVGDNGVIFETQSLTCEDSLEGGEPGIAELTCECVTDSETLPVDDQDTAQFACLGCDLELDKQVSCDAGATWQDAGYNDNAIDGCSTLEGDTVLVRYRANNPGEIELSSCTLTDSNNGVLGAPLAINPIAIGSEGVIFETQALECSTDLEEGEPDTARLDCECVDDDRSVDVFDQDTAEFDCLTCDVQVDRQVSCNGGATWNDVGYGDNATTGCDTLDGEAVLVRYLANNLSDTDLSNCTLIDTNGAVLDSPVDIGAIPLGFDDVLLTTDPLTCGDELDLGEPGTVTLSCECVEDGFTIPVDDADTADIDCIGCDVKVDKQVSCDGGANWLDQGFDDNGAVEGCTALRNAPVLVRYLANNPSDIDLTDCTLTDSNGAISGPTNVGTLPQDFNDVLFTTSDLVCSEDFEEGEPDTVELVCVCADDEGDASIEVDDADTADVDCLDCDVQVDRQVSCDGGATWQDTGFDDQSVSGCDTLDGETVFVRYIASNGGDDALENCTLTDSNGEVLGGPVGIDPIAVGFNGEIFRSEPLTCGDELDLNEPGTATLSCECVEDQITVPVNDSDTAEIDCIGCDVDVDKQVSCDNGASWQDAGYDDNVVDGCSTLTGEPVKYRYLLNNDSDIALDNCTFTDSNGAVLDGPFNAGTVAAGFNGVLYESDPLTCNDALEAGEPDTVNVTCECTDDGGASIDVVDDDTATVECQDCDVQVDRQVSCDGGTTWQDQGFEDGAVDGCDTIDGEPVQVRYYANNTGDTALANCELVDSNGAVLASGLSIGPIDLGFNGLLFTTEELTCSDDLEAGEPGTVTLTCECVDDLIDREVSDTDTADIECLACDVQVDKQVSCDDGATWADQGYEDGGAVESCMTLDGGAIRVRYLANNLSDGDLDNCTLTDSNGLVIPGGLDIGTITQGFNGLLFEREELTCSDDFEAGEPNTVTLTCECVDDQVSVPIEDTDTAAIECEPCAVSVDRQVTCDGGATWQDQGFGDAGTSGCDTIDGQPVQVRYLARNDGGDDLENCTLLDSNGAVLGGPATVGPLGIGFDGIVFETDPLTCSEDLDLSEPGTVTLSCECIDDQLTIPVNDTDTADIECLACDVQVDKQVSCDDGDTWQDQGYEDGEIGSCNTLNGAPVLVRYLANNLADVPLDNCTLTDSNGEVLGGPLAVGTIALGFNDVLFLTDQPPTCSDSFEAGEPNTVTLSCECVDDNGPTVQIDDEDTASVDCLGCDVSLDRQVSCDNGATWQDLGFDDAAIEGCDTIDGESVRVRYLADNNSDVPLDDCVLTDSNGGVLGAPVAIGSLGLGSNGVIFETHALTCNDDLQGGEPGTAELVCVCADDGVSFNVSDADTAKFECLGCDVQVDRQVSCDGGATWQDPGYADGVIDGCSTVDGESVRLRYLANNLADLPLENCTLTDSNGGVVGVPVDIGGLALDFNDVIYETDALTCDDSLEAGEPGTVTLTCECVDDQITTPVSDTDTAEFECLGCDVQIDKQFSCDGGASWQDVGYADDETLGCETVSGGTVLVRYLVRNSGDVDLFDCVISESNPAIGGPIQAGNIGVDESYESPIDDDQVCNAELEANEPDSGDVTCTCGDPGSGVTRTDWDNANVDCVDCLLDVKKTCFIETPGDVCVNGDNNNDDGSSDDDSSGSDDSSSNDSAGSHHLRGEASSDDSDSDDSSSNDSSSSGSGSGSGGGGDQACNDCHGKVTSIKFEYTGKGCGATTNDQEGRVMCYGGADGAQPVSIQVTDDRGTALFANVSGISIGDVFEATAAAAGLSEFKYNTKVTIDYGLETVRLHTSCSKPIALGDEFGSLRVVEITTTNGGTATYPDVDPGDLTSECEFTLPPQPHCDSKIQVLNMRYLGGDCFETSEYGSSSSDSGDSSSNDSSGGHWATGENSSDDSDSDDSSSHDDNGTNGTHCDDFGPTTQPVRIVAFSGYDIFLNTGAQADVFFGDIVDISAAAAGRSELPSDTAIRIIDAHGELVQEIWLHTSCSQPLNLGDIFGSLEVYGIDTKASPAVALAQEVEYTYTITNNSEGSATDVMVVDDKLGAVPNTPIAEILPGQTVTRTATGMISETTTNTVTVNYTEAGGECPAETSSATVTVLDPPDECEHPLRAIRISYTGPPIAGPVMVKVKARKFEHEPAIYNFPSGLQPGTVLSKPSENGWTIDASAHNRYELGTKVSMWWTGPDDEGLHTSCSTPVVVGEPAPLNYPKGDPSANWLVEDFKD